MEILSECVRHPLTFTVPYSKSQGVASKGDLPLKNQEPCSYCCKKSNRLVLDNNNNNNNQQVCLLCMSTHGGRNA